MSLPKLKEDPGVKISSGKKSKLDLFFDLQCPYSKKSWDTIGSEIENEIGDIYEVVFHPICLSHHRQSWDMTRAFFATLSYDLSKAMGFLNLIYGDHEQFYNANWKEKDQNAFISHLSGLVSPLIDVPQKDFIERLESDEIFAKSKPSIHFSVAKQVWSTPTIVYKGDHLDQLSSSSSISDWKKILEV